MLWLGADPRSEGPTPGEPDDPESYTTALRQVGYKSEQQNPETLETAARQRQPRRDRSRRRHVRPGQCRVLPAPVGAKLNDKPNGGSSALDGRLWNLGFDSVPPFRRYGQRPLYELRPGLDLIQKLCEHGALWRPTDAHAMNSLRRGLFAREPVVTTELLRIFRKYEVCSEETARKLLDTARMQRHLTPVENCVPRWSDENPAKSSGQTAKKPPSPRRSPPTPRPTFQLLRKYDRDVLYEETWSQPMWTLAKKYGISDVGLAKTCRKLGVPVTGRGYWAKKTARKKVQRCRQPEFVLNGVGSFGCNGERSCFSTHSIFCSRISTLFSCFSTI
jgi:hypothetical protein